LRVLEKMVLKRIFGLKREEVAVNWRRSHNKEFHNLCFSLYITRIIKPNRMGRFVHVARMGETGNIYKTIA